jgi:uncharacterized protein
MKTFGNGLLLIRSVCSCALLMALYLCLGAPLYAQTSSCPVGQSPSSGSRGDGDEIQCRINNVLSRNQTLINTVKNRANNCTGPHCGLLMNTVNRAQNAHDRAVKANGRVKGADYADLNTLRKVKCSGKNSDCAQGNGTNTGGDTDPTVGSDMADQLDDAANSLDDANNEMQSSQTTSTTTAADPPATFKTLYTIDSDNNFPAGIINAIDEHPLINEGIRLAILDAYLAVQDFKEIMEHACKQDVVVAGEGGNTSVACTALAVASVASEMVRDLTDFAAEVATDWEIHGAYLREDDLNTNLGQVDNDVLSVQASTGNTQAQITQLQAQITALQVSINALQTQLANTTYILSQKSNVNNDMDQQIIKLLLSPDGSRNLPASLLTCTGDSSTSSPCPPVPINCSASTGLCSFSPH